jgi:hypothetical protein
MMEFPLYNDDFQYIIDTNSTNDEQTDLDIISTLLDPTLLITDPITRRSRPSLSQIKQSASYLGIHPGELFGSIARSVLYDDTITADEFLTELLDWIVDEETSLRATTLDAFSMQVRMRAKDREEAFSNPNNNYLSRDLDPEFEEILQELAAI